ncbi:MAG: type II toxin-antitoxin system RelE/ParE family toxin [Rhodospirillaceae bacterium]|nr:type II toxin-antitoxin system RelE/ParE family toxin [Rhodospirillaceae bacterium]
MRVIFTPAAERQVERLCRYIADRASEQRAANYVERIVGFERRITIAFLVEPKQVVVQGVLYGGRTYEALLNDAE